MTRRAVTSVSLIVAVLLAGPHARADDEIFADQRSVEIERHEPYARR